MTKSTPFAHEAVMESYLSSLLNEYDEPSQAQIIAEQVLRNAPIEIAEDVPAIPNQPEVAVTPNVEPEPTSPTLQQLKPLDEQLESAFQALFFEVAGLTLAVPLITLGGIHQLEKVSPIVGKPAWFKGVMLYRQQKLSVVDSARWVMPEKYAQLSEEQRAYQYLVMLGDSTWGLACNRLVNTVTLNKADVQWREQKGKRPWLAGMVKQRMCALIDVYQLVTMLNQGLGSNDQML